MKERRGREIAGDLHRVRRGRHQRFASTLPQDPSNRPARVAVTLALAHRVRRGIESGEIRNQADAARRLGLTRARLSQILDLTNLAPDLQEEILLLEAVDGREPLSERSLRGILRFQTWAEQRARRGDPLDSAGETSVCTRHSPRQFPLRPLNVIGRITREEASSG